MKGFKIQRYTDSLNDVWDDFIERSKNGTFMLSRKFISYHGDRFQDSSLLIYKGEKLIAVFPANGDNILFIPIKV